jgi:hypothetical protein
VPVKSIFIVGGLVAGALLLLLLPADFFDGGPPTCLSVLLFNQTCFGCGMTRACQHLLHLQWAEAWAFNPLSFIVLPVLMYGLGKEAFLHAVRILTWWNKAS